MSPALRVQLLGDFHVVLDDGPVEAVLSSRLQALLAYLILQRGKPQLRQHLAFVLWPDSAEGQARTNLRHLLHTLRHTLPAADEYLRAEPLTLEWRAQPLSSDVAEFEQALFEGNFQRAAALYRNDLLPSCYDDWIVPERERLRQEFIQTLEQLILLHEKNQEYSEAIVYGQRALQQDPLRETSYQRLMHLYAQVGDRASVIRTFQLCVTLLQRELGVEPSETTLQAYEHLVRMDARMATYAPPAPVTFGFDKTRPSLPISLTSFVGREQAMADVLLLILPSATSVGKGGARLLTLTGAGGCGKTRLALQVARHIQELGSFADGVWLVELASLADPGLVVQTVASAFGVRETGNRTLLDLLVETLYEHQLLLVLDSCEHLITACAEVAETLLSKCPKLTILGTSREALTIAGELVWLVPSLKAPPPSAPVSEILESEAVRLFVERATAALPTFRASSQNAQMTAKICRELDGIPLAIELAAARVKLLSVEQLAQRLAGAVADRFQLLSGGSRTAGRHQTLRAAINWSHDLLPEEERIVFRRLSVFAGGFTLEAAEEVCHADDSDVLNLLAHLVDKSLVVVEGERQSTGNVRYRILEILRQYSREKLVEAREESEIRARHARFFQKLVEAADAELNGPDQLLWLNRLEAEHDNIREVLRWLESAQVHAEHYALAGLIIVAVLWKLWAMRGYQREGFEMIRRVLAWRGALAPSTTRLHALNGGSFLGEELGEYDATRLLLEDALATATVLEDKAGMAATLHMLGSEALGRGGYADAQGYSARALTLWRELGNAYNIAQEVITLGLSPLLEGDYAKAQVLLEEGVAGLRRVGKSNLLAYSLRQLARTVAAQGHYKEARAYCRESLTLNLELQSEIGTVSCLAEFADIAVAQGNLVKAAQLVAAVDVFLAHSGKELLAVERGVYEANRHFLHKQLDAGLLEDALKTGQTMSIEQAVSLVSAGEHIPV